MYIQDRLKNGIRVISKEMPEMRSVTVGVWIRTGSAFEEPYDNGVSHYIEHMLFKGTETRTAKDLADAIDGIGGQINAFTSKECTCYYVKVLDTHLDIGIDILSDMIKHSKFDETDCLKEKKIIYDEIALYEDSPEDVAYDLLADTIFGKTGLGQPILGSKTSLEAMTRERVMTYLQTHYTPSNIVISVAGSFNRTAMLELLNHGFGALKDEITASEHTYDATFHNGYQFTFKDIEQHHLCIGLKGVPYNDPEIYPLMVLNNLLGGGTSSRLFQNVREEQGLAYSIFSHPSQYKKTGLMTVYASFIPENLETVAEAIIEEIQNLRDLQISDQELERSKEQLKGNYILGLESTGSIMTMLGKSLLLSDRIETLDEVIQSIDAVKMKDVKRMIQHVFDPSVLAMTLVGRVQKQEAEMLYNKFRSMYQ